MKVGFIICYNLYKLYVFMFMKKYFIKTNSKKAQLQGTSSSGIL